MPNNYRDKAIAKKRINILFNKAIEAVKHGDIELSRRYSTIILELSKKYRVRLNRKIKRSICKKCKVILIPGRTLSIRIRKGRIIYRCLYCGNIVRYPFKKGKIAGNNK